MLHLVVVVGTDRIEINGDIALINALNLAASWGESLQASIREQTEVDLLTARAHSSDDALKAAIVADSTTT